MDFAIPAAGGMLIGLAALLLYGTLGRIAGVSGIAFGAVWTRGRERHWRAVFLGGLVAGAWLGAAMFALAPPAPIGAGGALLAGAAGLLVGFGTRMGNGCTSGHGVCGLARLSPRSLASVAVFMGVGMLVATLLRPLLA